MPRQRQHRVGVPPSCGPMQWSVAIFVDAVRVGTPSHQQQQLRRIAARAAICSGAPTQTFRRCESVAEASSILNTPACPRQVAIFSGGSPSFFILPGSAPPHGPAPAPAQSGAGVGCSVPSAAAITRSRISALLPDCAPSSTETPSSSLMCTLAPCRNNTAARGR